MQDQLPSSIMRLAMLKKQLDCTEVVKFDCEGQAEPENCLPKYGVPRPPRVILRGW